MTCARRRRCRRQRPASAPIVDQWPSEELPRELLAPKEEAAPEEAAPPEEAPPSELVLDKDGRVAVAGASRLDYGYRTFDGVSGGTNLERLRGDCAAAFSVRMRKGADAYSSGSTYWVGAGADRASLSTVERAALDVFELHSRGAAYDERSSGAEWWTLDLAAGDGSVAWHFDRDYALEGDVNLSPHVATVTYLGGDGAPTVVVPLVAPSDGTLPVAGRGGECFASLPVAGKHMSFDGRFLHAAPDGIFKAESEAGKRATLLVNVWLDWRPEDADVLPPAVRAKLSTAPSPKLDFARERKIVALPVPTASVAEARSWTFAAGSRATKIALRVPALAAGAPDAVVLFQETPAGPPLVDVTPK